MASQLTTGSRLRLLLKHGIIFGLTSSLQSALSFILLPLYTNYLSLSEFGNYNMLLVWAGALNTLFGLGASSALGRYYYEEKSAGNEKEVISASLWISSLGALLLISLSLMLAHPISTYYFHDEKMCLPIIICVIANALTYPTTTLTLLLRYKKQSLFYLVVTLISLLLNFGITITLLGKYHAGIISPFIGQMVTQVILFVALYLHERKNITFAFSKRHYSMIFFFGMQIIVNAFLAYIYECSDKMVMKEVLSIEDVGIYSLSNRIGSVFRILIYMPFVLIWTPLRMEFKDSPDNKKFVSKINNYYTIFGCLFIILCMVWGYDVLRVLFPKSEYSISLLLYPICLLANLFYGYQSIYDFGIYINNKLYYQSIICVITLLFNVGMNIVLLPEFGVSVSAYIYLATYILTAMLLYIVSNRFYPISLEWVKMSFSFLLTIGIYALFFHANTLLTHNAMFKTLITLFVFCFCWRVLFSNGERAHILNSLKNKWK